MLEWDDRYFSIMEFAHRGVRLFLEAQTRCQCCTGVVPGRVSVCRAEQRREEASPDMTSSSPHYTATPRRNHGLNGEGEDMERVARSDKFGAVSRFVFRSIDLFWCCFIWRLNVDDISPN